MLTISGRHSSPRAAKVELISRLAGLIQKMHACGFNHRDLYLCHILRDGRGNLYIVDLHRVQRRAAVPERWLVKDIAALNYSAPADIISRTNRLRFLKTYLGTDRLTARDKRFALKVLKKTQKMVEHNKRSRDTVSRCCSAIHTITSNNQHHYQTLEVYMRDSFLVFGSPIIEEPEIQEVVDCLRSGWIQPAPAWGNSRSCSRPISARNTPLPSTPAPQGCTSP